jgi:hypothetical protein
LRESLTGLRKASPDDLGSSSDAPEPSTAYAKVLGGRRCLGWTEEWEPKKKGGPKTLLTMARGQRERGAPFRQKLY